MVRRSGASLDIDVLSELDVESSTNPLLFGLTPSRYVLRIVRGVPRAQLDAALLSLPLDHCVSLLRYVHRWLELRAAVELSTRIAVYVVRVNSAVLSRSAIHAPLLDKLVSVDFSIAHNHSHSLSQKYNTTAQATLTRSRLRDYSNEIGFNEAALTFVKRELEARAVRVYDDTNAKVLELRRKAKAREARASMIRN